MRAERIEEQGCRGHRKTDVVAVGFGNVLCVELAGEECY